MEAMDDQGHDQLAFWDILNLLPGMGAAIMEDVRRKWLAVR